MSSVKEKYLALQKKINKFETEVRMLQSICEHKDAVKTYKSNTGNYDPHQDSYWEEHRCPDCNKFWTVDIK